MKMKMKMKMKNLNWKVGSIKKGFNLNYSFERIYFLLLFFKHTISSLELILACIIKLTCSQYNIFRIIYTTVDIIVEF
jgi:hypothetical protein